MLTTRQKKERPDGSIDRERDWQCLYIFETVTQADGWLCSIAELFTPQWMAMQRHGTAVYCDHDQVNLVDRGGLLVSARRYHDTHPIRVGPNGIDPCHDSAFAPMEVA